MGSTLASHSCRSTATGLVASIRHASCADGGFESTASERRSTVTGSTQAAGEGGSTVTGSMATAHKRRLTVTRLNVGGSRAEIDGDEAQRQRL
uniref:Uncharacterized protein n=1 Tax=Leersia perrieri TaxID=77586 RepID=A0A0D9XTV9_9ORYZ